MPAHPDIILTHQAKQLGIIYELRKPKPRKPPELKTLDVQPNCEPSNKITSFHVQFPEPSTISISVTMLKPQSMLATLKSKEATATQQDKCTSISIFQIMRHLNLALQAVHLCVE